MTQTFLHITDPHLLASPDAVLHGWPVADAFCRVLEAALAGYPDFDALILGGDLVDDESTAGYRWLNRRLAALGRPILAVAGNHDDPREMTRELTTATVHGALRIGPWTILGLDTHVDGQTAGRLGQAQLRALDRQLAGIDGPVLIALHHPPWPTGSAWMDTIGLVDADRLNTVISRHPQVAGMVCGHAHQQQAVDGPPCSGWITPSTMRQFEPGATSFAEDTNRDPGYRRLAVADDGRIETTVIRVTRPTPTTKE